MKEKMPPLVLVLQIDALRHDYVEAGRTPFLARLAGSGLSGTLIPPFGFEPDYAFFAGLHPDEANAGAQFVYSPATSPFGFVRGLPGWCDHLPSGADRAIRRAIRWLARRVTRSPFVMPARIPYRMLPFWDVAVPHQLDAPDIWPRPTVFDLLRRAEAKWLLHLSPEYQVDMGSVMAHATEALRPPLRFAFFHIVDLDSVGHRYGPDSRERLDAIGRVDAGVSALCALAGERFRDVHLLVFGDHGMATVQNTIDIQAHLRPLKARSPKDYIAFFDSTMARFWFSMEQSREEVLAALGAASGGHWLTAAERDRYHLNYKDNRFGDEIYVADPGVVVSPNYHQAGREVKGMHGYIPEFPAQQSHFSINSTRLAEARRFKEAQDMRRLFPTMLDLLGIAAPETCDMASLVEAPEK